MIRKAQIRDVPKIHTLINHYASQGLMLPLSLSDIYESLRDFVVYGDDGDVAGCCALKITWEDLAEVRSLAVRPDVTRKGIGTALVGSCIEEARQLGLRRVFVLTYLPDFFQKLGFARVSKDTLPHKVWSDCVRCPKFPDCREEALILEIRNG